MFFPVMNVDAIIWNLEWKCGMPRAVLQFFEYTCCTLEHGIGWFWDVFHKSRSERLLWKVIGAYSVVRLVFRFICTGMNLGISKNSGTPKWMVYKGKLIKMDDLGVPLFLETPKNMDIFKLWRNRLTMARCRKQMSLDVCECTWGHLYDRMLVNLILWI